MIGDREQQLLVEELLPERPVFGSYQVKIVVKQEFDKLF